jgi:ligand-binding sensor domain-containing protein
MLTKGARGFCLALTAVFALGQWMAPGEPTPVLPSAPDGEGHPPQYAIHHWTPADDIPALTIQRLLQTRDGYLWIGTRNGLVRFNGKEFRTTTGMNCRNLAEDSEGVLWIGCSEGLVRWDGIDLQTYRHVDSETPDHQQEVVSLCSSREGGVWAGWEGDLWRAWNGKLWKVTDVHQLNARSLCESRAGRLYVAGPGGVRVLEPANPPGLPGLSELVAAPDSSCAAESPDGALWLGGAGDWARAYRVRDGQMWEYP